jgi:hypothetical protein
LYPDMDVRSAPLIACTVGGLLFRP